MSGSGRVIAFGAATKFDERRNTSRVFPVAPGAGAVAAAELARYSGEDWYRWAIAYGRQEHLHGTKRADGRHADCPVRGCAQ